MRTTVAIDDELLVAARRRARELGITLGGVIESALRRELATDHPTDRARPPIPILRGGTGPRPGVDLTSNAALHEVMDDGVPLIARR